MREASEAARHDVADVIRRSGAMLALDEAGAIQRPGLDADLTSSPRTAPKTFAGREVASLFADAGMIAITAFICSGGRDVSGAGRGQEDSHVKADVSTCEGRRSRKPGAPRRDPGVHRDEAAELVADTSQLVIVDSVRAVIAYVERNFTYAVAAANS